MPKAQTLIDIVCVIFILLSIVGSPFAPISVENEYIPTIVNGITSSISLILAFSFASIALFVTRTSFKPSTNRWRLAFTIMSLFYAVLILLLTFAWLTKGDFHGAIRLAMMGLLVSVFTLLDFIAFLTSKIQTMQED